jgi:hypothetical protein
MKVFLGIELEDLGHDGNETKNRQLVLLRSQGDVYVDQLICTLLL